MTNEAIVAKIAYVKQSPKALDTPWTHQVAKGYLEVQYVITVVAVVPGLAAPVEANIYTPAGVWHKEDEGAMKRVMLPLFEGDVQGVVTPVDFNEWAEKRSEYGAFPEFNAAGELLGMMPFKLGGIEYDTPLEAYAAFICKGGGWSISIPKEALEIAKNKDGSPLVREWTDKKTKVVQQRIPAKVRGFELSWFVPPTERVAVNYSLRAAFRRAEVESLGEKPTWVRR